MNGEKVAALKHPSSGAILSNGGESRSQRLEHSMYIVHTTTHTSSAVHGSTAERPLHSTQSFKESTSSL